MAPRKLAKLELTGATVDALTDRMLAHFGDADGNMLTVNSIVPSMGSNAAKAVRTNLVALLRQTADILEAVDTKEE